MLICVVNGCPSDSGDCYTCRKQTGGYWSSGGWVTEYETKLACGDKNADELLTAGWECPDYNPGGNVLTVGRVYLKSPANGASSVPLDVALTWEPLAYSDGSAVKNVTYDVLFGTPDAQLEFVSEDQAGLSFAPALDPNTEYRWMVVAFTGTTSRGSDSWTFTTAP